MNRRVVITGVGSITPIGKNSEELWESIKTNKCGVSNIEKVDVSDYKVKVGAEIKGYNAEDFLDKRSARRLDEFSQFAVIAAKEAWLDCGIDKETQDMEKVGVILGSGIGGLATIEKENRTFIEKGNDKVAPMYIPSSICNMAAGNVAIEIGAKGDSISMVTACASGTHCIGESFRMIRHGYQDVIVAGGTEASITATGIAGFANIKALTQATDVNRASIPFDKERSGFVMGEGSGVVILEEYEHAKQRGAKIYAELVGYSATSDAYHITSPAPGGEGGARAMLNAIKDAGITPTDIEYINAHGTSTSLNDSCETAAIKSAFGDHASKLMVSSTKGNTGHLLGAAGSVEAIICAKALQEGLVPATINFKEKDEDCDLDVVPNENRKANIKYAISNSLGFGGHNASLVFKKFEN